MDDEQRKPLALTSTDHALAIGYYVCMAVFGSMFMIDPAKSRSMAL